MMPTCASSRLGVRAFAVEADSGAIDGNFSHEFITPVR
jgi:prolyl-tRNA synthetase